MSAPLSAEHDADIARLTAEIDALRQQRDGLVATLHLVAHHIAGAEATAREALNEVSRDDHWSARMVRP